MSLINRLWSRSSLANALSHLTSVPVQKGVKRAILSDDKLCFLQDLPQDHQAGLIINGHAILLYVPPEGLGARAAGWRTVGSG